MAISAQDVKKLRDMTSAGMMECKKALKENNGDFDAAVKWLREKGAAKALKRADKEANEGIVYSYIHPGNKVGVMIQLSCETDFVAKTDDFLALAKEAALQVASMKPKYVRRSEVPQNLVEEEKAVIMKEFEGSKKPETVLEKIAAGKIDKFYSEICLEEQVYVRDSSKRILDLINEMVAKVGEKIAINKFARYEIGE